MKGRGMVMVLGLVLLGSRCSDTPTRPPAPPSGWIIPLVAPDSTSYELIPTGVVFQNQEIVLMGFLTDSSGSSFRNFVGRLTWSGTWVAFHVFSHGQGGSFLDPVQGRQDLIAEYPLDGTSPCRVFLLDLDGAIRHTLTVTDPRGSACAILDVLPQTNGFLVAGITMGFQGFDTLYTFLAFLEATSEGYRQTRFQRYQRGTHPFNLGGPMIPLSGGIGLLGITSDNTTWGDRDSLWLLKLTSLGEVVAETTLAYVYPEQFAARGDTAAILASNGLSSALVAFDFRNFRVLWSKQDVPYRLMDALPTGPFLGAIAADSGAPKYVQLRLHTGEKTTSRDLWTSIRDFNFLRTGPVGFLVAFWGWDYRSSYLAYVPYGGDLPPLPDSLAVRMIGKPSCLPVSRLALFLEKARGNPRSVTACQGIR